MQSDPNVPACPERAEELVEDTSRLESGGPPTAGSEPLIARLGRVVRGETAGLLKQGFEHTTHWAHTTTALFVFFN
jgi:hypothetical protein